MKVRLLRKVAKEIEREPRKLDMRKLAETVEPAASRDYPPCGTVGCIAGWACLLSDITVDHADWDLGKELLGLNNAQAARLFTAPEAGYNGNLCWPHSFAVRYVKAKTPRGRMLAAVARIEHFIRTRGAE